MSFEIYAKKGEFAIFVVQGCFGDKFMVARKSFSLASPCSQASREPKKSTKSSAYLTYKLYTAMLEKFIHLIKVDV